MKCYIFFFVVVIFLLVAILCSHICNGSDSLKVIIPICCLILGLTICVVVLCKKSSDSLVTENKTTVIMQDVNSEEDISLSENERLVKAYILVPKEN